MNVKLCVTALLCLVLTYLLSFTPIHGQALRVGDAIPDELWDLPLQVVNHPSGKQSITLSEYKDKLIILDFWATWCAPCLKGLTKLDSIQKIYPAQLAVIPLTYESAQKAEPTLAKRKWTLSSVINDTLLKAYFPHKSIPHQIFIKDGKVLSIPLYSEHLIENLNKIFNNEIVEDVEKTTEQKFDPSLPLLINGNGGSAKDLLFQSKVSRSINTAISGERSRSNNFTMYNYAIQYLFLTSNQDVIPWHGRHNRIISKLDSNLNNKVFQKKSPPSEDVEAMTKFLNWRIENVYCYQLILPQKTPKREMYKIAHRDLNNTFGQLLGINVAVENIPTRSLVIVASSKQKIKVPKLNTEALYENCEDNSCFKFINQPFSQFFGVFAEQNKYSELPIIDLTGYTGNISLTINGPLTNLEMVKQELNRNGFELQEKEITIPMLVFKKLDESHISIKE
jgi:thiol-disulfide isomerase/thioredoxin